MQEVLEKVAFTRDLCTQSICAREEKSFTPKRGMGILCFLSNIQVDGGINNETAKQCIDAAANALSQGLIYSGRPICARPLLEWEYRERNEKNCCHRAGTGNFAVARA